MKEEIDASQVFWLAVNLIISTIILLIPNIIVGEEKQTSWIAIIVAGFIISLLQYMVLKLGCSFSKNNIIYDCKLIFGSIVGRIIIIPYILLTIWLTSVIQYESITFIGFVMKEQSEIYFWFLVGILACYLAYCGIETIARVAKYGIVAINLTIIIIIIINFRSGLEGIDRLKPLFFHPKHIIKITFLLFHWFLIIPNLFLVLKSYLKDNNKAIKFSLLANIYSQVIIISLIIAAIVVLGANMAGTLKFPFYMLSTLSVAGFEIIVFMAWIMGTIIKLGIYYFISLKLITSWFNLKGYRNSILPFFIMVTSVGIFQTNIPLALYYFSRLITLSVIFFQVPFLLFLAFIYMRAKE